MTTVPEIILVKLESGAGDQPPAPPYGILYLASALEQAGFSVKLIHEKGTAPQVGRIVEDVIQTKPLFVGFSCLSGPSLSPAILASKKIKEASSIPIVWGGVHSTMLPEQTLESGFVDLVVMGEGEETVVELACFLKANGRPTEAMEAIKGIAWRKNGTVRVNPLRPLIQNLDDYAPAWHLLNPSAYIYKGRYYYSDGGSNLPGEKIWGLITSRGCPWRCGYCFHELIYQRRFRAHSAERVIRDIEDLKNRYGITAVNFQDANFFSDKTRAFKILRAIRLPWNSSMRANDVACGGEDFVQELADLQCIEIQVGAESGSQYVLDLIRKDIKVEQIRTTARLAQEHGIRVLFSFMIGLPGEAWADSLQTLDLMDELRNVGDKIVINGPFYYFPFPGTPLYDKALQGGYNPPRHTEDWNFLLWGIHQPSPPYADRRIRLIEHYRRLAWDKGTALTQYGLLLRPLETLAAKRWKHRFFRFPLDYYIPRTALRFFRALGQKTAVCFAAGRGTLPGRASESAEDNYVS